ncbi:MAG: VTT domain-containing protein [Acutalibacteraceae bacterium]|nr:VTT domain-containing protein [Acutalibacteraceae bacterium]
MKKETVKNIAKIAVAAAIFVTAIFNYDFLSNLDIRTLIAGASSIFIAELIILGVYAVKAVMMVVPASLIYISVGMAFDPKRAVIVNLLGIALEVTVTYFLGKFLGKDAVEKKIRNTKAGDKFFTMLDKNRSAAIFLMRFIPAFPIDFSSLFMGAFDFKFFPYLIFSVLGIAPRVIAFTVLGEGIYELIPMKYIVLAAICAIPVVTAVLLVKKFVVKKKKSEEIQ